MSRKVSIANRFTKSIPTYDLNAALQIRVAKTLGELLPTLEEPEVLELGSGTGILTDHLLQHYPRGRFLITDISSAMIGSCMSKYAPDPQIKYAVMDCDALSSDQRYDIIVSSMVLHWSSDPVASLDLQRRLLKPGGRVVYCTIGPHNFPEWRETLSTLGHRAGLVSVPCLPGLVHEEKIPINYGSAEAFLKVLKSTGASVARPGYRPMALHALKKACYEFNRAYKGTVTWHVVYGILS